MTISDTIYLLHIQFNINDLSYQIISFMNIAQIEIYFRRFIVQYHYSFVNMHKIIVYN